MAEKLEIIVDAKGTKKASNDFKTMGNNIKGTVKKVKSLGNSIKEVVALGGAVFLLKKSFDFAKIFKNASRDAEETASKFRSVFDEIPKLAENMSSSLARDFKLADDTAKKLLSTTGDLLSGFGYTDTEALKMSDSVNRLAIDLASFQNFAGGSEGASRALTSAMMGNTESAKSLGIIIRQDSAEFKEQIRILTEVKGMTIQQAKAQVILQEAYKQSKNSVGDFARTQEQLANQERILAETTKQLKIEIGDKLKPVFASGTRLANSFLKSLIETDLEQTISKMREYGAEVGEINRLNRHLML